ncbi:MAG: hypothetical protein IVW57_09950 [Ktedonobacterales bacterium]|nr:hypothetical protein [Ktedonobacterales bacterium]
MGKLIDKLQHVSQSSGSGFGFLGRTQGPTRVARPAAILVTLRGGDTAAAEAAAKNGADAIILTDWAPGAKGSGTASALAGTETLWGVDLGASVGDGLVKGAQDAGASFVIFGPDMPARALFEEVEHFDRVITVDPPSDDLALLLLRGQSLLPAQAALVRLQLSAADLARLSVTAFTRLRFIMESLRFPALVTLAGPPEAESVRTLVHLGVAGLVLPGGDTRAIASAVKALREELERTPIPHEERGTVLLGGMTGAVVGPTPPTPPRREPEREPEREPDHE